MSTLQFEHDGFNSQKEVDAAKTTMSTEPRPTDECDAVERLRELLRGLDETHWSSWQTTAKFSNAQANAQFWLDDYDQRKTTP